MSLLFSGRCWLYHRLSAAGIIASDEDLLRLWRIPGARFAWDLLGAACIPAYLINKFFSVPLRVRLARQL